MLQRPRSGSGFRLHIMRSEVALGYTLCGARWLWATHYAERGGFRLHIMRSEVALGYTLCGAVVALGYTLCGARWLWATHYAERGYVERFTVTPCSEKLVTTHNVSLCIREDLGPI